MSLLRRTSVTSCCQVYARQPLDAVDGASCGARAVSPAGRAAAASGRGAGWYLTHSGTHAGACRCGPASTREWRCPWRGCSVLPHRLEEGSELTEKGQSAVRLEGWWTF